MTVTVDLADWLYLSWAEDVNTSGLMRKAARNRMRDDGITPGRLQSQIETALENGYSKDEIRDTDNQYQLDRLLDESTTTANPNK